MINKRPDTLRLPISGKTLLSIAVAGSVIFWLGVTAIGSTPSAQPDQPVLGEPTAYEMTEEPAAGQGLLNSVRSPEDSTTLEDGSGPDTPILELGDSNADHADAKAARP